MIKCEEFHAKKFFFIGDKRFYLFKSLVDLWVVSHIETAGERCPLQRGFVLPGEKEPKFVPIPGAVLTIQDLGLHLAQCSVYGNCAIFKGPDYTLYLAQFRNDLQSRVVLFRKIPNGRVHVVFDGKGKFVGFISGEDKVFQIKDENLHYTEL